MENLTVAFVEIEGKINDAINFQAFKNPTKK